MTYIFYNPETLKVMGMSSDSTSMDFPVVETGEKFHSSAGFSLEKVDGRITVKIKEILEANFVTEDNYEARQADKQQAATQTAKNSLKKKMKDGKITAHDLAEFIIQYL